VVLLQNVIGCPFWPLFLSVNHELHTTPSMSALLPLISTIPLSSRSNLIRLYLYILFICTERYVICNCTYLCLSRYNSQIQYQHTSWKIIKHAKKIKDTMVSRKVGWPCTIRYVIILWAIFHKIFSTNVQKYINIWMGNLKDSLLLWYFLIFTPLWQN